MTPEERAEVAAATLHQWKGRATKFPETLEIIAAAIREAVKAERKRSDALAAAAKALSEHIKRSVNVGPLTRDPSREAKLWRALLEELAKYEASNPRTDSAAAIRERPL